MGRVVGGAALLLLSLLMLWGFLRSSASLAAPATLAALVITVVLPAAGGVMLLRGGRRRDARVEGLRQKALEAEILRMATRHGGRLTAVEVATELAMTPEGAKETLDGMMTRGIADLAITAGGMIVYTFDDARQLGGGQKQSARGILED